MKSQSNNILILTRTSIYLIIISLCTKKVKKVFVEIRNIASHITNLLQFQIVILQKDLIVVNNLDLFFKEVEVPCHLLSDVRNIVHRLYLSILSFEEFCMAFDHLYPVIELVLLKLPWLVHPWETRRSC